MIKLTFIRPKLTITSLSDTELPDFVVLTGKNGTGKSQLLDALHGGDIKVEGISIDEIGSINQRDFNIANGSAQTNMGLLNYYQDKIAILQSRVVNYVANNPQFQLTQEEKSIIYHTAELKGKPVHHLESDDFAGVDPDMVGRFIAYKQFAATQLESNEISSSQRRFIDNLLNATGKIYEDITFADTLSLDYVDDYSGGVLPQQLQFTIMQYHKTWQINEANSLRNEHRGRSLPALSDEEFESQHGRKPWEVINESLSLIEGFKYKLDFDENSFQSETEQFALEFTKKDGSNDIKIPVTDLSSGEKTLVALVVALYSASSDKKFPKLILLDEIDATLHPSMASIFLNLLQSSIGSVLGTKIILVTHSPSTVALAPDSAVYTMQTDTDSRLLKTTKQNALNQLTEGFVALTDAQSVPTLQFTFKDAPKDLIFFEGPSDIVYLRHADSTSGYSLANEFDITYAGSFSQLKNFWKLIRSSDASSGYTHGKSATLIYDCDIPQPFEQYAHHTQWSISRIDANPINDGIENLLRPEFIDRAKNANPSFFYESNGVVKVNDIYKMELASWFEHNADSEDIAPFTNLISEIKSKAKHSA